MVASKLALLALSALISSAVGLSNSTCSWAKAGCYKDLGTTHPLVVSIVPSATEDTTLENCQAACAAKNYPYAGVENGYQCWCDYTISSAAASQADSYCNVACFGNATEMCGGSGAMGVFHNPCITPVITVTATATISASSSSSITFSTVTVTKTVTPTPTQPPPPPPPTPTPTRTTRRPRPTPTTTPRECDTYLCCLLYPDYCDDNRKASLSALATATAMV